MNRDKIMDYLYGEMEQSERLEFEKILTNDHNLQAELQGFKQIRSFLGESKDLIPQPINMVVKTTSTPRRISPWWAVAASLLVLMLAGKILDFRIESHESHLVIGFGPMEMDHENLHTDTDEKYASLQNSIESLRNQLASQQIPSELLESKNVSYTDNQKLAGWIVNAVKQEQSSFEDRLANKILEDQQIYIQGVAQDLMQFWDEQRKNDLQAINSGMQQLVQLLQVPTQDLAQFVNNTQQNY